MRSVWQAQDLSPQKSHPRGDSFGKETIFLILIKFAKSSEGTVSNDSLLCFGKFMRTNFGWKDHKS